MVVAVNPVVVEFGSLAVRWFGLLALVGLGLAVWLSVRGLEQHGLGRTAALDALAWGLPAGLLVGRLVYVLGWWDYFLTNSAAIWQLNVDGLSLWGGLLGGLLMAGARLKRDAARRRRILDVIAPNVGLGIAIGRLGAFLDGHGQGLPSDLPWATQYASPLAATPDFGVPRHPAQLYDALIALGLFVVLSRAPRRLAPGGRLAALLVLYGAARVLLGAVRLDPAFLFGLQIEQLLALGAVACGLVYGLRPVVQQRLARLTVGAPEPRPREDSLAA
ncbi:MAG: prolipoprotein diacylglyceryl transferase [Chloroflexi bacterium]|nr:prolipoprotein diacylglyceryl transferase [Chloroflexota bacterium]